MPSMSRLVQQARSTLRSTEYGMAREIVETARRSIFSLAPRLSVRCGELPAFAKA